MDPRRKRTARLIVALSAAVLLAGALVYTSFSAASEAKSPSQLLAGAQPGQTYQLSGKVVPGSIHRAGDGIAFRVRDRKSPTSVPVSYVGEVPDPFRDGREIVVNVQAHGASFTGERDSLVTKCPSKFKAAPNKPAAPKY